ncbi:MAG TPA: gluconeogenesis factor YvcK family protein [Planctomycetota bacterium]|nr:gluconeogenesis factor YvcK family protein [Planctomycetota bacterium]
MAHRPLFSWLLPGLRIKRWLAVILAGIVFAVLGSLLIIAWLSGSDDPGYGPSFSDILLAATLFLTVAAVALTVGFYRLLKSVGELLRVRGINKDLIDIAYERRYLGLGPAVVCLGGGTGLSTLLVGLKDHTSEITAVVSMADDGGSSGKLRRDFDIAPPGDIRKCMVALADDEPLIHHLMDYRFPPEELEGHCFGNLLLTVFARIKGNFGEGVREANRVLGVRGKVVPSTLDQITLMAHHADGTRTIGQKAITQVTKRIVNLQLIPDVKHVAPDIFEAIGKAELIVLGPGSLFTSVLPSMLIADLPHSLAHADAVKVLVVNGSNSEGETRDFRVQDHVEAVIKLTAPHRVFDVVLIHKGPKDDVLKRRITEAGGQWCEGMLEGPVAEQVKVVYADVLDENNPRRHDPKKLATALMDILRTKE